MHTPFTIMLSRQQLSAMIQTLPADECRLLSALLQRRLKALEEAEEEKEELQLNDFDETFLSRALTEFDMDKKIRTRFRTQGLTTVGDVMTLGRDEFVVTRNLGPKCWMEFYEKVLGTVRSKDEEILMHIRQWQPETKPFNED